MKGHPMTPPSQDRTGLPERLSVGVRTATFNRNELILADITNERGPAPVLLVLPVGHKRLFEELVRRYNAHEQIRTVFRGSLQIVEHQLVRSLKGDCGNLYGEGGALPIVRALLAELTALSAGIGPGE